MKNLNLDNAQFVELSREELVENNGGWWLEFWTNSMGYGNYYGGGIGPASWQIEG